MNPIATNKALLPAQIVNHAYVYKNILPRRTVSSVICSTIQNKFDSLNAAGRTLLIVPIAVLTSATSVLAIAESVASLAYSIFLTTLHTLTLFRSEALQNHTLKSWSYFFNSSLLIASPAILLAMAYKNNFEKRTGLDLFHINCAQAAYSMGRFFDFFACRGTHVSQGNVYALAMQGAAQILNENYGLDSSLYALGRTSAYDVKTFFIKEGVHNNNLFPYKPDLSHLTASGVRAIGRGIIRQRDQEVEDRRNRHFDWDVPDWRAPQEEPKKVDWNPPNEIARPVINQKDNNPQTVEADKPKEAPELEEEEKLPGLVAAPFRYGPKTMQTYIDYLTKFIIVNGVRNFYNNPKELFDVIQLEDEPQCADINLRSTINKPERARRIKAIKESLPSYTGPINELARFLVLEEIIIAVNRMKKDKIPSSDAHECVKEIRDSRKRELVPYKRFALLNTAIEEYSKLDESQIGQLKLALASGEVEPSKTTSAAGGKKPINPIQDLFNAIGGLAHDYINFTSFSDYKDIIYKALTDTLNQYDPSNNDTLT